MTTSLQLLFEAINQVKSEPYLRFGEADALRSHLAPKIGEYFAANRSGIFFFDQLLGDRKLQKILNVALPIAFWIPDEIAAASLRR